MFKVTVDKLKFSKWQAVLLPFITISTGKIFQPISCGNGSSKFFSSKGRNLFLIYSKFQTLRYTVVDSMLSEFLKDEIEAEKKIAKQQLPTGQVPAITGFQLTSNEDEITLNKTFGSEKISVKFHVSHSVDTAPDFESDESQEQQKGPSVISKPSFTVSIEKENQKLVFECAFIEQYEDDVEANQPNDDTTDLFNIEEIYMYSGDATDNIYSVRGDIIDGGLYDHLMTYLEERGIDHHFAEQLIKFSTHYEHAQYVALLQRIREFVGQSSDDEVQKTVVLKSLYVPENQSHLQRITVDKAPPVYTAFNYNRANVIPLFVSPLERIHYSLPVKLRAPRKVKRYVVRTARGRKEPRAVVGELLKNYAVEESRDGSEADRLNFGLTFVFIDRLASLLQVRSDTIIEI
ncbi:Conserved regulator of innate immunity protein 3 [Trichinella sp. T9]|nr:Conserved regulator of innate immunity protein 3 [Trichinella sp. T9]